MSEIPADRVFLKINKLIKKSEDLLINFDDEKEKANRLIHLQHETFEVINSLKLKIKEFETNNKVTLKEIKEIKKLLDKNIEIYIIDYTSLKKICLRISVAINTEEYFWAKLMVKKKEQAVVTIEEIIKKQDLEVINLYKSIDSNFGIQNQ